MNTSARLLLDLAVYCETDYSQSQKIRAQVMGTLNAHENQSQLIEAVQQHAMSSKNVDAVMKQFNMEPKRESLLVRI